MTEITPKVFAGLKKRIRQAGLIENKFLDHALRFYHLTGEEHYKEFIEERTASSLWRQEVEKETDPYALPEHELLFASEGFFDIAHPLICGEIYRHIVIRLGTLDLQKGIAFFGAPGSGKSVSMAHLASQAMDQNFVTWLFDREDEFYNLLLRHPELLIIRADEDQDCFNLFEPPSGMSIKKWTPIVIRNIAKYLHFSDGTTFILIKAVFHLSEKYDGIPPSLNQILQHVEEEKDKKLTQKSFRELGYYETAISRITLLIAELGEKNATTNKGFDFKKLSEKNIVFVIRDWSETAQNIYTGIYVLKLMYYNMANKISRKHLLFFDEITSAVSRKEERSSFYETLPVLITVFNRARKRGIACVWASQFPSQITRTILNVGAIIVYNLNSSDEFKEVYGSLLLTTKEQKIELGKLPPRTCIICRHGISEPIRCFSLDFELGSMTKEQGNRILKSELEELNDDVISIEEIPALPIYVHVDESNPEKPEAYSYEEILKYIQKNPGRFAMEIALDLGYSPATVSKDLKKAVEKGIIRFEKITRGVGNPAKIPVLTEQGEEIYGKQELKVKGGVAHFRWLQDIKEFYRRYLEEGFRFEEEYFINSNESIDLVVLNGTIIVLATELELAKGSYEHCIDNIEKCLRINAEKIISCYENKRKMNSAKKAAKERLSKDDLNKVIFATLPEFVSDKVNKELLP